MIAVKQRALKLLIQKYHKELEQCKNEKEIVELLNRVARNENLQIKRIKPASSKPRAKSGTQ